MKTTLTIEQSAELIRLGVSPKKSIFNTLQQVNPTLPPIFSIDDVFSMLPKEIKKPDGYTISLAVTWYGDYWTVKYPGFLSCMGKEFSDALFGMMVKLIDGKYVKPQEL